MTTALQGIVPEGVAALPEHSVRLVRKKHDTLLRSVILSAEWTKRCFSLSPSILSIVENISSGANNLRMVSSVAASIPSIFKIVDSITSLAVSFQSSSERAQAWPSLEQIQTVASTVFFSLGDVSYLLVVAHTFKLVELGKAIPGLQIVASSIFGISAIKKIGDAWRCAELSSHDRMLITAKEVSSVAIGALGIISLTTTSTLLSSLLLVASTAWVAADFIQYALTPPKAPPRAEIPIEDIEALFA